MVCSSLGGCTLERTLVEKSLVQAFLERGGASGSGLELGTEKAYVAAGSGKRSRGQQRQQVL